MPGWYLIQTKRARETLAEANLERQGYDVYLPRLLQTVRRGSGYRERVVALFPGYLFLRLHEGRQALDPVRSTKGVSSIVRFGRHYATAPERLIDQLRARADPDSGLHRLHTPARLERGTTVTIASAPFDGLEGIFERESGADRAVILVNLLGNETRVQLRLDSLLPVSTVGPWT